MTYENITLTLIFSSPIIIPIAIILDEMVNAIPRTTEVLTIIIDLSKIMVGVDNKTEESLLYATRQLRG